MARDSVSRTQGLEHENERLRMVMRELHEFADKLITTCDNSGRAFSNKQVRAIGEKILSFGEKGKTQPRLVKVGDKVMTEDESLRTEKSEPEESNRLDEDRE